MCTKSYNTSMLQFADIIIDTFGSHARDEAVQIESFAPRAMMLSCNADVASDLDLDPIPVEPLTTGSVHPDNMPLTFSLWSLLGNTINKNNQYGTSSTNTKTTDTISLSRSSRKRMPATSHRYSKIKDPNGMTLQCSEIDILLGRGGHASNHTGNVKLLHAVKMNRALYKSLGRTEIGIARKRMLVRQIVAEVRSNGSRFLYREKKGGEWREASSRAVYEKICHMLRD